MNDCLFCKIVEGEIPSHKIYEDEKFLAFLDVNPINPGHTLIIPKEHSRNILEMNSLLLSKMIILIKKLSIHIKEKINADGINVMINNEKEAGQIIFHTHIHIIPRFKGDGFGHWKGTEYKKGEAEKIKKILETNKIITS